MLEKHVMLVYIMNTHKDYKAKTRICCLSFVVVAAAVAPHAEFPGVAVFGRDVLLEVCCPLCGRVPCASPRKSNIYIYNYIYMELCLDSLECNVYM